jgi:hypothetical protein
MKCDLLLRREHKLQIFENNELEKIFDHKVKKKSYSGNRPWRPIEL